MTKLVEEDTLVPVKMSRQTLRMIQDVLGRSSLPEGTDEEIDKALVAAEDFAAEHNSDLLDLYSEQGRYETKMAQITAILSMVVDSDINGHTKRKIEDLLRDENEIVENCAKDVAKRIFNAKKEAGLA